MVLAQSRGNPNSLLPSLHNTGNRSILLGYVYSVVGKSGCAREAIEQQFWTIIGDEKDIEFWNDDWTCRGQLTLCFPRIFALAKKKTRTVSKFGRWEDGQWRCHIELRRRVFNWEVDV